MKPDAAGRFNLPVSGRAEVASGIVLTLERVVADSRCPVDVQCIWAGEIRVAFALESPGREEPRLEFELATTAPTAEFQGLQLELMGADPAPHSRKPIAAADYRIALRVTPAPRSAE